MLCEFARYGDNRHRRTLPFATQATRASLVNFLAHRQDPPGARSSLTSQATMTTPASTSATTITPTLRRVIRLMVFVGGVSTIGIELSASRLIAPYFGDSTFIWANLIGMTMLYLSIGYKLGGRVADRAPRADLLFGLTAIAGFAAGMIPFLSRPILRLSLDAFDSISIGAFYGSLLGVILLFAVPITLLGFVSPFAIRLLVEDVAKTGNTAGGLYALGTVGSLVGSFLPALFMIPLVGTTWTFYILSLALILVALFGLVVARRLPAGLGSAGLALLLTFVTISAAGAQIKPPYRGVLVHEAESAYNYIQVLDEDGRILLALNEGQAIHSVYDPTTLLTGGPWDYFTLGPAFAEGFDPENVRAACIVGLAGGTAARELAAAYPGIAIDGVEIDPVIADLAYEYFGLGEVENLDLAVEDGRYFLNITDGSYDLIILDAYHQPYIPFQLTTVEFFETARDRLNPGGSVVVNVGRTETDFRLVDVLSSTMREVFPYVFAVDVVGFNNTMLIGLSDVASIEAFTSNLALFPDGSLGRQVGAIALAGGNPRPGPAGGDVFTDDHAPIELITDLLILDAARKESS
jgi:predicted membrane-bound spermidine synthase